MKKPVAILSSILLAGSIVMTSVTPAMAGNASYKFYSLNGVSKENYNTSWQEFNTKAVTGRDWVVKASKITLPDNTTPSYGSKRLEERPEHGKVITGKKVNYMKSVQD